MLFARSLSSRLRTILWLSTVVALMALLAWAPGAAQSASAASARAARPNSPAAPVCEICGLPVSGRFMQAGGHTYCQACYNRYPKCASCGLPVVLPKYHSLGRPVCNTCADRAGVCANCGDVLLGRYFVPPQPVAGVRGFCENCSKTKPKCALCGLPYRGMTEVDGQFACASCIKKAIRCSTCGQPILGRYFSIEFQPGQFCRKCYEERPHCSFCGRPFIDGPDTGARDLPDGRCSCPACAATAVESNDEALDLLAETVRFLEKDFGMRVRDPYDLVLVDNQSMGFMAHRHTDTPTATPGRPGAAPGGTPGAAPGASKTRDAGDRPIGSIMQELGLFNSRMTPESPRMSIALLSDLPRAAFLETVAHEYAHLWLYAHNPDFRDTELNEGFAQWIAAKWLANLQMRTGLARLEARRDNPYGTGYQAIRGVEAEGGVKAVFAKVLGGRPFETPSGPDLATALDPQGKSRLAPLSELLSPNLLDGSYGFLRQAVVVNPSALRVRPSHMEPVASSTTATSVAPPVAGSAPPAAAAATVATNLSASVAGTASSQPAQSQPAPAR